MALYPTTQRSMLEKIKNGDQISWGEFYGKYAPVIRILGMKSGVHAEDLDDLVQEVMRSFFQSMDHFCYDPARARFRTYFNRIVRGRIGDIFRRRELPGAELTEDLSDTPFDVVFDEEWRKLVLAEAHELLKARVKSQTYLAYTLTEFEKWDAKRAAEFLGISENSVYVNRKRCFNFLKKTITALSDGEVVF